MLAGGAAHTHEEAEGEQEGCPACGAPAVEAEPAAKVYLSLRRQVACIRTLCGLLGPNVEPGPATKVLLPLH